MRARTGCGLVLGLVALLLAGAAGADLPASPCTPGPMDPDPLPMIGGADPVLDRWAREESLRIARAARQLEGRSLLGARWLWERVLCLDPSSEAASAGLFRTGRFRVPGPLAWPGSLRMEEGRGERRARLALALEREPIVQIGGAPWEEAVAVTPPPALPPVSAAPPGLAAPAPGQPDDLDWSAVDQELSEIRQLLEDAHFRTALQVAAATRALLAEASESAPAQIRRARLEVLSATAAVALGDRVAAAAHMERAVSADPDLSLDPVTTSPKVLELLSEVRRRHAGLLR